MKTYVTQDGERHLLKDSIPKTWIDNQKAIDLEVELKKADKETLEFYDKHHDIISKYNSLKHKAQAIAVDYGHTPKQIEQYPGVVEEEMDILEVIESRGYTNVIMPDVIISTIRTKMYYFANYYLSNADVVFLRQERSYHDEIAGAETSWYAGSRTSTIVRCNFDPNTKVALWTREDVYSQDSVHDIGSGGRRYGDKLEWVAHIEVIPRNRHPYILEVFKQKGKFKLGMPRQKLPSIDELLSGKIVTTDLIEKTTNITELLKKHLMGLLLTHRRR